MRRDTATLRGGGAARPHLIAPETSVATRAVRAHEPDDVARASAAGLRRVLLLNASREPLCVVSAHRAVTLVLSGKAVVLEEDTAVLRSEKLTLPAPHVLCLTRYVHVPYRPTVPPTRRTVLQRDDHRCAYCAAPADTVDHVHPRSRGGRHEWTNVVAACARCNHRKADRLLAEIGWQLLVTPSVPRVGCAVLAAAARPHPSWSAYLAA
ncbi:MULTISPECIES: HNH endonuclease [unclassified Actinotalea]|uniref:HNH endonuclease n=1 Tax=unclassified Actinotalea TaxID=2638618 RepID=UPI00210274AB|nr:MULTISPECIES: HNH endonuclease [unclassified Actinotalea]